MLAIIKVFHLSEGFGSDILDFIFHLGSFCLFNCPFILGEILAFEVDIVGANHVFEFAVIVEKGTQNRRDFFV